MIRFLCITTFLVAAFPIWAGDQNSASAFGTGSVEIELSSGEFSLSLSVPSADILGFERQDATDADRALVAMAVSTLSEPLKLFLVPEQAGCTVASASVTLTGEALGQAAERLSTSQFQADYIIQCSDMSALQTIEFAYFDRFERTEMLIVQTEDKQSFHVSRTKRFLNLSALHLPN